MFFSSAEEKLRVEEIVSILSILSEKRYSAKFENCVKVATNEFKDIFGEKEWDIITITSLSLYDRALKSEKCRSVNSL